MSNTDSLCVDAAVWRQRALAAEQRVEELNASRAWWRDEAQRASHELRVARSRLSALEASCSSARDLLRTEVRRSHNRGVALVALHNELRERDDIIDALRQSLSIADTHIAQLGFLASAKAGAR